LPPTPTVIHPCGPSPLRLTPRRGLAAGFSAPKRTACARQVGCATGWPIRPAGSGLPHRAPGFAVVLSVCTNMGHGAAPIDVTFARFPDPVVPGQDCRVASLLFRHA